MSLLRTLITILTICVSASLFGQGGESPRLEDADPNAAFKASFLFLFSTNVDWPDSRKSGEFKIGIVGNTPVFDELVYSFASKLVGSQVLTVTEINSLDEVTDFHIVFVSRRSSDKLKEVVQRCAGKPVLVVAEAPEALATGAEINFVIIDSLIRYELDPEKAANAGLLLGSKIIQYAVKP